MGNKYYYFYDLNEVLIDRYPSRIANKIRDLDPNSSFIFIYSEKYNGDEPKKTPKGSKSYFIPSLKKKKLTKLIKKYPPYSLAYAFDGVDEKRYPRYFNTPNQEPMRKLKPCPRHSQKQLVFLFLPKT